MYYQVQPSQQSQLYLVSLTKAMGSILSTFITTIVHGSWHSADHNTPLALTVSCGYFRTAIRELIPKRRGIYVRDVDMSVMSMKVSLDKNYTAV